MVVKMTLSKKEQYRRLNSYDDVKWQKLLEPIEDCHLKRKVACIVFWDFYNLQNKRSPYLKTLVRLFNVNLHEDLVPQAVLYKELLKIGYPKWRASERSRRPKCHR